MARRRPDMAHVTIADRGHVPFLDEPEALTAIDAFLKRYPCAAIAVEATNTYHEGLVERARRAGWEVYLVSGDLIVGNDANGEGGEPFQAPTYACRPPGVHHGPFKSVGGCILFEIHYYRDAGRK